MKKSTGKWFRRGLQIAALGAVGLPGTAGAFEVAVHGYGHQGYLRTFLDDGNGEEEEGALEDGSWAFTNMALVFTATITDDTRIWTQIFGDESAGVTLDWAFVEHQFVEGVAVRAGQIKLPMALHNEVRDAKILHLTSLAPFLYYESAGIMTELYKGVGARVTREALGGTVSLDAYFGESLADGEDEEEGAEPLRDLVGGRLRYDTPLEGLSFLATAQSGKMTGAAAVEEGEEGAQAGASREERVTAYVGSLSYDSHELELSAEYGWAKAGDRKSYTYYVEAGYELFGALTPFVRYDYITTDEDEKDEEAFFQKDVVAGLRYRFNANVAAKAEYHWMKGYALGVGEEEGTGDDSWQLLATSVNFAF